MTRRKKSFAKQLSRAHLGACRMVGYALHLGADDFDGWMQAAFVWRARLSAQERAALAYAAMRALDPEDAAAVADAALGADGPATSVPLPPINSADVELWAETSGADALEAYAEAAMLHMPAAARDDLLHRMRRAA